MTTLSHRITGHTVLDRDPHRYTCFPTIDVAPDGTWIAAWRRAPGNPSHPGHPPGNPFYWTVVTHSSDQGRTWSTPEVAPGYDWSGCENPGLTCLRDGTVLLFHFRFGWYPLGLARSRWEAGERVALDLPGRGWREELCAEDFARASGDRARVNLGTFVHRSVDGGRSFPETVQVDTGPFRAGYSRCGAVECTDGVIRYAVGEHWVPYNRSIFLLQSADGGRSWQAPTLIAKTPHDDPERVGAWNEPHLTEVAPGELLCILCDREPPQEHLWSCRSLDGGVTWSLPERTPMYGHPGHLLVLHDGRVLCTYGRRESPFGIRACWSDDGGRTWAIEHELVLRDDYVNQNLGYPATIEYAPGELFTIYYGEEDGVTGVSGTRWELR
jgi:hypothetical protein